MTERTIYVSEDGKEFNNKEDCLKWEKRFSTVQWYNEKGELFDFCPGVSDEDEVFAFQIPFGSSIDSNDLKFLFPFKSNTEEIKSGTLYVWSSYCDAFVTKSDLSNAYEKSELAQDFKRFNKVQNQIECHH